jgi:hypothetical protein
VLVELARSSRRSFDFRFRTWERQTIDFIP